MSSNAQIANLDAALKRRGSDITLRRQTTPMPTDLNVRGSHRNYEPDEIMGNVEDGDAKVILSPTGLSDTAWVNAFTATGGEIGTAPFEVGPGLPKRGDQVILDGRARNIEFVNPITINNQVVRIELQVR